jgi:hypothetical protein
VVAVAALALPSLASAATVVYTPGAAGQTPALNGSQLSTAVTSANAAPAGTQSIIELCQCSYQPTAPMSLSGNIEITGPPSLQVFGSGTSQGPEINGQNASPQTDLFVIAAGAHVLFKAFDLTHAGAGPSTGGGAGVNGTLEADNMDFGGEAGWGLEVFTGGTFIANNTCICDNGAENLNMQGGTATLNQSSVLDGFFNGIDSTNGGPISGTVNVTNTVIANNNGGVATGTDCVGTVTSSTSSIDSDGTCGVNTTQPYSSMGLTTVFNNSFGGPTLTHKVTAPSTLIGAGTNALCAPTDQRFFPKSSTSCDVGSYQTTALTKAATTAPTCTVPATVGGQPNPNYGTNPATMTVNAGDGVTGIGADAMFPPTTTNSGTAAQTLPTTSLNVISTKGFPTSGTISLNTSTGVQTLTYTGVTPTSFTNATAMGTAATVAAGTAVLAQGSATTDNGMVSWPIVSGTPFAMTLSSVSTTSSGTQPLPATTFNVTSTTGFATSGTILVQNSTGVLQTLTYMNITPTSFTGVSGGTGTVNPGALVTQGNPTGTFADQPSTAAFAVTATKPVGDTTHGDTHWSFTVTNWLGISKLCI